MADERDPEPDDQEDDGREIPPAALKQILDQIQGIDPGAEGMIAAMAEIHAKWFRAWTDTGAFDADHAFELVRILVATSAGGVRILGLSLPQQRQRRSRGQGGSHVAEQFREARCPDRQPGDTRRCGLGGGRV